MRNGILFENERHYGTIIMYPYRSDIWRNNAYYMRKFILNLVDIISKYEHVFFICRQEDVDNVPAYDSNNITKVVLNYDDIWARDIAPTFICKNGSVECIDWKFNAWGGKKEGSYFPYYDDDNFARKFAEYLGLKCKRADITLEGGAILSDGYGTIFSTKSVLLNRNRNPFKSKDLIEKRILDLTGDKRIVWLRRGLANDETNGHIDNIMSVVSLNELCLAWTDDKKNPNYSRVREAYSILAESETLDGNKYKIYLIPLPSDLKMTSEEADGLFYNPNALLREKGFVLPASYLNYYILNGAILLPAFGCDEDKEVKNIFSHIFYDKEIIQIYSREPLLGGGGLHCILHEVPLF